MRYTWHVDMLYKQWEKKNLPVYGVKELMWNVKNSRDLIMLPTMGVPIVNALNM